MRRILDFFTRADDRRASPPVEGLTLYHFSSCPFCVRVRLAARRLGLRLEERNIHRDSKARDELLRGGGKTQVPCLRIEGRDGAEPEWLYESGDIVEYLETHFA